jgi:hypothetical protein
MRRVAIVISTLVVCAVLAAGADLPKTQGPHWEIAGRLSEACTCRVPCTCNFGEGPSPKHYCWAMFAVNIERGHYGSVPLDGLHFAGAHGKKDFVWYIDARATTAQAAALRAITASLLHRQAAVHFETAQITQVVGEKSNEVEIGDHGGFKADYIIGFDGKTPVVVENNSTWNIQHSIKAKTHEFQYRDQYGNKFKFKNTNSNQGQFDWTDQTPKYF